MINFKKVREKISDYLLPFIKDTLKAAIVAGTITYSGAFAADTPKQPAPQPKTTQIESLEKKVESAKKEYVTLKEAEEKIKGGKGDLEYYKDILEAAKQYNITADQKIAIKDGEVYRLTSKKASKPKAVVQPVQEKKAEKLENVVAQSTTPQPVKSEKAEEKTETDITKFGLLLGGEYSNPYKSWSYKVGGYLGTFGVPGVKDLSLLIIWELNCLIINLSESMKITLLWKIPLEEKLPISVELQSLKQIQAEEVKA